MKSIMDNHYLFFPCYSKPSISLSNSGLDTAGRFSTVDADNLESFLFHHPRQADPDSLLIFKHSKLHSFAAVLVTLFGSLSLTALVFLFCYCSSGRTQADDNREAGSRLNRRHKGGRCVREVLGQRLLSLRRKLCKLSVTGTTTGSVFCC